MPTASRGCKRCNTAKEFAGEFSPPFSSGLSLLIVTSPSLLIFPRDLLLIEGGYTLIATILVGAIIGGLSGRLVLPALEAK